MPELRASANLGQGELESLVKGVTDLLNRGFILLGSVTFSLLCGHHGLDRGADELEDPAPDGRRYRELVDAQPAGELDGIEASVARSSRSVVTWGVSLIDSGEFPKSSA